MQYDRENLNAPIDANNDKSPLQCNGGDAKTDEQQSARENIPMAVNSMSNGHVIDVTISPNGRASIIEERSRILNRDNDNKDSRLIDDGNDNSGANNSSNQEEHKDQQQFEEPEQMRKLFIGGLDYRTSEETLQEHFERFGEVIDCVVMREPHSRRSRGFGFVTYARSYMVDKAQEARPHRVDGREVEPKRAIPRGESGKPETQATVKKVFLGGLSENLNESDLREYFKDFGNIVNISIATQKDTGKKRGFAFVEFDDYDPVDKIVLKKHHLIKETRLEVKKAIPKIDMDARRGGPRMAAVGNLGVVMSGPPFHAPSVNRSTHRGPRSSGFIWDNGPYPGTGFYQPHYQPSHYGPGNWMTYSRSYMGGEGRWTTEHNPGHSVSQGEGGGPVRLSYQYRSSGPYGSHRSRNYNAL